jgi:hypothetical protein
MSECTMERHASAEVGVAGAPVAALAVPAEEEDALAAADVPATGSGGDVMPLLHDGDAASCCRSSRPWP